MIDCTEAILFLRGSQTFSPLRPVFIGTIALLWLICFCAIFIRDKRKAHVRSVEKRKQTTPFVEKRAHKRVSYPMFILYRVLDPKEPSGSTMLAANARNLSEGGIYLEVKEDLPIGAQLELKLTLGGKPDFLFLQGSVNRKEWVSSHGAWGLGVTLGKTTPEEHQRLARFIDQERRREEMV